MVKIEKLVLLLIGALPCLVNAQKLYVIGHAVDMDSQRGIPGAKIYIQGEDSIYYRTETDEHGWFRHDGLHQATYTITALKDNYLRSVIVKYDPALHSGTVMKFTMCKEGQVNAQVKRKPRCPNGHGKCKVIPIQHGLHTKSDSLQADKGKVMLGEQCFNYCQERWFCKSDSLAF